jgi:SWI/SNF-related matrix-associated actin-dependent regulator of chromatin subfamily D
MEDVLARTKMNNVVVNMSSEGAAELNKLDEEVPARTLSPLPPLTTPAQIMQHAQSIQNAQTKLTFLRSFADDPAAFIDTWLASQARDLDAVLGGSEAAVLGPGGHGGLAEDLGGNVRRVRAEELRRSEFFQLPWVEEAVAVQEGMRLARLNA